MSSEKNKDLKQTKYIKKILVYLLYERNIAVFYHNCAINLVNFQDLPMSGIPLDFYLKNLLLMSKYALLSYQKLNSAILEKKQLINDPLIQVWDYFDKNEGCQKIKEDFALELEKIREFYQEIEKKVKFESLELLNDQKQPVIIKQNYEEFLEKALKIQNSEEILLQLKIIESEIPIIFENLFEKLKKEALTIIYFVLIGAHPYKKFEWTEGKKTFDFEGFYEDTESLLENQLKEEIINKMYSKKSDQK